jgi:glyceraldehyde 3-phosphate dehydrogenase
VLQSSRKSYSELNGKLGMAFRVPTTDVSAVDLTVKVAKETSYEDYGSIEKRFRNYHEGYFRITEDLVVSQDFCW